MVRWEPGTRERLQGAALELYLREGFEQTTVAQIAESAGVTERTFFRHFADKREVLFDSEGRFGRDFLDGVAAAPGGASALEAVAAALRTSAAFFPDERRSWCRDRQAVITANPGLQEREQLKLTSLAVAAAAALRTRGVRDPAAILAAESGLTVFEVAFAQWIAAGEERSLLELELEALRELGVLARGLAHPV